MSERDILDLAYNALNCGTICKIKLPPSREIHDFNMMIKNMENDGLITVKGRDITNIMLELTEAGLESCLRC